MGEVDDEGAQHFFLIQPESAEDALNAITALLGMKIDGKSVFQLIVLDSVASMATRDQLAGEAGDVTVASLARVLAAWTSSNKGRWTASSTALLFINQARSKIGVSYGDPDTYPGGRALRHHCSIIAKMRAQGDTLKDAGTGEIVARTLRLETKKNKVAPPFRSADVKVFIDDSAGADPWSEMAAVGRELGVFTKEDGSPIKGSCSWFLFGERVGVGEAQVTNALKTNKDMAAQVYAAIQVGMNGQQDLPRTSIGDSNEGGNEDAS